MACGICGSHARENISLAASTMGVGNPADADHYLSRAHLHQTLADTHSADDHNISRNGSSTVFVDHRGRQF